MTQATIISALQNGPLTSKQLEFLTGFTRASVLASCKKLRYKGDLTTEQVKVGRSWVAEYTLAEHLVETKVKEVEDDEPRCLLNPFDIRNAKGIFTPTEYKLMNAHARRLYSPSAHEITNNQYI
jgi:hypothetical protein